MDYNRVYEVLAEAKRQFALYHLEGHRMRSNHDRADDLAVASRQAKNPLKVMSRLLKSPPPLDRVRESWPPPSDYKGDKPWVWSSPYEQELKAIETLRSSEALNDLPDPEEFTFPKGRRPKEFLKWADRELRTAGVKPKNMRDNLLRAVGVKKWHDFEENTN